MTGRRLEDGLEGESAVLLAGPSIGGTREVCPSLLAGARSTLFVTFADHPEDCVARTGASPPEHLGVVTVGQGESTDSPGDVTARHVAEPGDLTRIGIEIEQFLSARESPVAVCFDSVTSLLQYADFETGYEFLHTVVGRVRAAGGRAHFHVDPVAHDGEHVAAITSLCDARVTVHRDDGDGDGDGEGEGEGRRVTVRTRGLTE